MTPTPSKAKPKRKKATTAQLRASMPNITAYRTDHAFRVVIGFPNSDWTQALTPHAEGHWRTKSPATKMLRSAVRYAVQPGVGPDEPFERATVAYHFWFPNDQQRDEANFVQRMKPAIDGIGDAGVFKGDHWQVFHTEGIRCGIDRKDPRIEIVVKRAALQAAEGGEG